MTLFAHCGPRTDRLRLSGKLCCEAFLTCTCSDLPTLPPCVLQTFPQVQGQLRLPPLNGSVTRVWSDLSLRCVLHTVSRLVPVALG